MTRFLARIIRFGLTKRLRRGARVTIFPSYQCNYRCDYCTLKVDGVFPRNGLLPLSAWQRFLTKCDEAMVDCGGIREVILTGGEPTLLPYFKQLYNWILFEKRWHLTIFTNLSNLELLEVKSSIRLRVDATFHHHADLYQFNENYKKINRIHRVDVEEIGDTRVLPYSRLKPFLTEEEVINSATSLRVAPDQSIHLTCRAACEKFCKY